MSKNSTDLYKISGNFVQLRVKTKAYNSRNNNTKKQRFRRRFLDLALSYFISSRDKLLHLHLFHKSTDYITLRKKHRPNNIGNKLQNSYKDHFHIPPFSPQPKFE